MCANAGFELFSLNHYVLYESKSSSFEKYVLDLRQYKNDSIQSSKFQLWNYRTFSSPYTCSWWKKVSILSFDLFLMESLLYCLSSNIMFSGNFPCLIYNEGLLYYISHFLCLKCHLKAVIVDRFCFALRRIFRKVCLTF